MKKKKVIICILLAPALTWACGNKPALQPHTESVEIQDTTVTEKQTYLIPEGTIYDKQDSITIEKLLAEAQTLKTEENRMLFFGKQFIGIPYVAHTLEKGVDEVLVVNTRELDCTTFIETCTALTLADQKDIRSFAGYCQILRQLRYRQGIIDEYPSRLHYFSQWIADNEIHGVCGRNHP